MEPKRNMRSRNDQTKRTSEFGSPIMWTHDKDGRIENKDSEELKQKTYETGKMYGVFDVNAENICSSEKTKNILSGEHATNRQGDVNDSKEKGKEKYLGIMTGCKEGATVRNVKRTTTVSSDSDEYDTDLELDNEQEKENRKPDRDDGTKTYTQACRHWNVKPLSCVIDNLTKQCITLKNTSVGPKVIFTICAALRDNRHVERLNLDGVDITHDGIQHIEEVLIHNDTITHLNVANNNLGLRGAQAIGHVMVVTDAITHLNLSGNKLNDESAWYLTSGINTNTSITHLDVSYNELGVESGVLLGSALGKNNTLRWLNMCWNKIYGRGAVAIFRGLMLNNTIERLDISWNGLGYEGSVALSKCLKVNTGLRYLNVTNNRIDWRCAVLLAEGLRSNDSLSKLMVGFNPLTTTGVMDILEAVATDDSGITFLDCSEVPVLCTADLLAATVGRLRTFRFIHGGIVSTHDKLGERVGQKVNPMLRIIEYLRLLGLRPLELLRSFDRSASFEMPRDEFIDRIKKIGVKLHGFEIEALANTVSGKGYNKSVINYRKLSMAVRDVVEAERRRKIKEREEWKQMKNYQKNILKRGTVEELLTSTSSNAFSDSLNPLSSRSTHTITHSAQGSTHTSLFPSTHRQRGRDESITSRRLQNHSTKEEIFLI